MTAYAKDPSSYTYEVLDSAGAGVVRPVTPTITRVGGTITIAFNNDEYVYQETGQHPGENYPNPVDGSGAVELFQEAPPEIVNLDHPWLTALRVTDYYLDYGEYNHPFYASSNGFQYSCIALDLPAGYGYGVAPNDGADIDPREAPTGWAPHKTLPLDLVPPFWLGSMGTGGGYNAGIWYGSKPPGLLQNPDLILNGGNMTSDVGADGHIERALCRVTYGMGGFQEGPYDPTDFGYHPLYVQPGSAHITIDAFIFEGAKDWYGEDVVKTRAAWGMISS